MNKETAVLLVPLFFIGFRSIMTPSRFVFHLILQAAIYLIVKGGITYAFAENPGSFVEIHFAENLRLWAKPAALLHLIAVLSFFGFFVLNRWREKPTLLRSGLITTLAPLMFLALFFGNVDETRGYYEAFPFAFLLSLPTLLQSFDVNLFENPPSMV